MNRNVHSRRHRARRGDHRAPEPVTRLTFENVDDGSACQEGGKECQGLAVHRITYHDVNQNERVVQVRVTRCACAGWVHAVLNYSLENDDDQEDA